MKRPHLLLALVLIAAGVALRIAPHPWNFAPIGAIALFGGAHFQRRSAGVAIPLIAMFLGDLVVGLHALIPMLYLTYALIALLGTSLRNRRTSPLAIGGSVLASSLIFYVVSNFGMWTISTMYPRTSTGLVACYIGGLPLLGNTLASDALFTSILFGAYALFARLLDPAVPAPA
jgi:hypothetical protein